MRVLPLTLLMACTAPLAAPSSVERASWEASVILPAPTDSTWPHRAWSIADLDGDGGIDLVELGRNGPGKGRLRLFRDLPSEQVEEIGLPGRIWSTNLAAGDVNGDGRTDLVLARDQSLFVWVGADEPLVELEAGLGTVASITTGHVNGDDLADIVVVEHRHQDDHRAYLWLGSRTRGARQADQVVLLSPPTEPPPSVVLADMTGDGADDLVVWDEVKLSLRATVDGLIGAVTETTPLDRDSYPTLHAAGDVDADGDEEVVMMFPDRGTFQLERPGALWVWHGGPSPLGPPQALPHAGQRGTLAVADLDADGRADVATSGLRLFFGGDGGLLPERTRLATAPPEAADAGVVAAAPGLVVVSWSDPAGAPVLATLPLAPPATDADGDGWDVTLDPDDGRPEAWPGAPEIPSNGLDDDGDGWDRCRRDEDFDGFAGPELILTIGGCGLTRLMDDIPPFDCNDLDPRTFPGALEPGRVAGDLDCDGVVRCREALDRDQDGHISVGNLILSADADCDDPGETLNPRGADCDDSRADVHPDADDVVGDRVDSDCDGQDRCYRDDDHDGARSRLQSEETRAPFCVEQGMLPRDAPIDCDDTRSRVAPGRRELRDDGVDQDCDGWELCRRAESNGLPCRPGEPAEPDARSCAVGPRSGSVVVVVAGLALLGRRRVRPPTQRWDAASAGERRQVHQ